MMEKFNYAVLAIAICTLSGIVAKGELSLASTCRDCALVFALVVAYLVLADLRSKAALKREDHCDDPPSAADTQLALMQKYALQGNIGGAIRTFRSIQQSGECMRSVMYNCVLQAHVNCGNLQAAEDWLDEMREADMADEASYQILVKALVTVSAPSKAQDLLKQMRRTGVMPKIELFNAVIGSFAQEGRLDEAISVLEEMRGEGMQLTASTFNVLVKLINGFRDNDPNGSSAHDGLILKQIANLQATLKAESCLSSDSPVPVALPCLSTVVAQAHNAKHATFAHEMRVTGSFAHIKAVRRTLKQLGFLDKTEGAAWPLDGHWETDHGLTVIIEGKLVRWSGQRASRLRLASDDRRACVLRLYGVDARGQLVSSGPDSKTIRWDNGDVWNSYNGRAIGQDTLYSQSMTKTLRDTMQDQVYRARACAVLKCLSKQALGVPTILEHDITQFLGNDLYYLRVQFESMWNPSCMSEGEDDSGESDTGWHPSSEADICDSISRRHPRVGLRHCWAERDARSCGQRTLVNGKQIDEDCFNRHIKAVTWT